MKKGFLLACSNIRRSKSQTAAITILVLLSSLMLNIWLMLAMDYKQNFDRYHDRMNAEHVTLSISQKPDDIKSSLTKMLENDSRTADYCMDSCMYTPASFQYNDGEVNTEFIVMDQKTAKNRPIGKTEIVEEGSAASGIYLPMLYKTKDIDIGKTIDITIGSHTMKYTICGFLNNIMAGSHNCSMAVLILTDDNYEELEHKGYASMASLVSVRLHDKAESEDYEAMLSNQVSKKYPSVQVVSNSYTTVSQSRYISQMICSGIFSAMAFFVLLVALVVIASNIVNYIQENMKNLGALKAVGYTSSQLIGSLLLQFVGLSLAASMTVAALSYCVFPTVNTMMISQTGIPYAIHFLALPFFITLAISGGTVALAVWASAHRIRHIEPITALRQGMQTHNFKQNHIPLDRTRAPLQIALALKTTCSSLKQNITICITMLVISLIIVFSSMMITNMLLDITPFLELIVGETADSCINVPPDLEEDFVQKMHADKRVERVYLYHSVEVRHTEGTILLATISDDFSLANNQNVCIEGRFPKYDNETAIAAKYAKEHGFKTGDVITLSAGDKKASYIISGFTQISNNLGKDCLLTREGYEKLGSLTNMSYYLILAKDVDIDQFNDSVTEQFSKKLNAALNVYAIVAGSSSVYVSLMTIIVAAVLVLSVIITTLVLYLLVRTMLNNKKREYGILKALGFTTRQLIFQTAASLMPAVILSTIIGLTICSFIINPLTAVFLSSIGIVKCTFSIPAAMIAAAGIILILFTFSVTCLLSVRIKRISPRALLAGE